MKKDKYLKLLLFLLLGKLEYNFWLKRFAVARNKEAYPLEWCIEQIEILKQIKRNSNLIF